MWYRRTRRCVYFLLLCPPATVRSDTLCTHTHTREYKYTILYARDYCVRNVLVIIAWSGPQRPRGCCGCTGDKTRIRCGVLCFTYCTRNITICFFFFSLGRSIMRWTIYHRTVSERNDDDNR